MGDQAPEKALGRLTRRMRALPPLTARCSTQTGTLIAILAGLAIARDQPIVAMDALDGPFRERLEQNKLRGLWSAPLLIAQGEADEVIPFSITEEYIGRHARREPRSSFTPTQTVPI